MLRVLLGGGGVGDREVLRGLNPSFRTGGSPQNLGVGLGSQSSPMAGGGRAFPRVDGAGIGAGNGWGGVGSATSSP